MLELENITKSFDDVKVLKNINLSIEDGQIVALLGKSGSGKSTILNIIAGFEQSNSGVVKYQEQILQSDDVFVEPNKRDIGFVFQNYALFPHLNVEKNISFGIDKLSKKEQQKIVDELLELVNLKEHSKKYPQELSGGQSQRVAIARVLARQSKLILLDEPFSSIDTHLKTILINEFKTILKQNNKTAIFVTHCPKEALLFSDKIAFMEDGEIIQYDNPKNILLNPKSKAITEIFGNDNLIFKPLSELLNK